LHNTWHNNMEAFQKTLQSLHALFYNLHAKRLVPDFVHGCVVCIFILWDSFNLGACQVQFGWTPQWICYGFFPKGGGKSVVLITSPICTFHYHVDWVWLYVTNVIIPTSITLKIHHLYLMGRQPNIRCMSSLRAQCTPG